MLESERQAAVHAQTSANDPSTDLQFLASRLGWRNRKLKVEVILMSLRMVLLFTLLVPWQGVTVRAADSDRGFAPGPEKIPEWLEQGKLHFTRLDGGPIEILKTSRSEWGKHFTDAQKEVLANLYTKYSDRMLDLLEAAHINQVWLTWSVGYSWEDEAEQRDQCKRLVARLHQHHIKASAYACSVSMFWESMFRDEPRSVRWIRFDPNGVPFRYSGGHDPLRFIADVSNPEYVELVKRRVGAAIDAGFDTLFFDNTASAAWSDNEAVDAFMGKIRRYIHEEKKSNLLLYTNYGLTPDRAQLNRNMDFVFAESWREPGVWGPEWDVSNVRRTKYMRGVIPEWKPLTTEYSIFHSGNRATTFLSARSQKLATAEAAAFQSDYCWDMEGPFDAALMSNDAAAMAAWKAIGQYRLFLQEHEDLYWRARSVSPIAVVVPTGDASVSFAWDRDTTNIFDALSRHSVLYDIRLPSALDREHLQSYRAVVLPPGVALTAALSQFKDHGGKVYTAASADDRTVAEIRALFPQGPSLNVEGAPHVLGNVTRLGSGKRLAVHLLNYAPEAVSGVRVRVNLGDEFAALTTSNPVVFTPDGSGAITNVKRVGSTLEFTLDRLDTYTVVVLGS
jgi:hypothetical protein